MLQNVFELDTLGPKKFICDPESGNWVLADACDERVIRTVQRPPERRFYTGVSLVLMNVSRQCNLDCTYCVVGGLREDSSMMPYHVGKKVIERVMELPEQDRHVVFHGSEPMTNFQVIERLLLHAEKASSRIRFSVQSNGSLFNRENVRFLVERGVYIGISLDGTHEHQDNTRPYRGGASSYDDVVKNVRLVREMQGGVGVIVVVTRSNVNDLESIVEHFESEGIDTVYFCPVGHSCERIVPKEEDLTRSMINVCERYLRAKFNGTRTIEIENVRKYLINLTPRTSPSNCVQCSISAKYPLVAVDINGDIFPCDYFWGNQAYLLGNVFSNSLESVVNQTSDFRMYRDVNAIRGCAECKWKRFCGGGCPGASVFEGRGVRCRGSYCRFNRAMLQYMVERIPLLHEKGLIKDIVMRESLLALRQL